MTVSRREALTLSTRSPMTASLGTIRQFLLDHFNDEELDQFCFDYFNEARQSFGAGMSVNRKAMLLVDYCQHRDLLPAVLAALKDERPEPFRRVFGRAARPAIQRININTASADELQELPNIGPALARSIIAARPYGEVDELARVAGIGSKRLAAVRDWCSV